MTDYLTRLLARTQGAIPTEQLAQPLLQPTFAPVVMDVEQPVEVYEERTTQNMTSPLQQKAAKVSSDSVSHANEKHAPISTSQAARVPSSLESQTPEPIASLHDTDVEPTIDHTTYPTQPVSTPHSSKSGRERQEGDRREIVQQQSASESSEALEVEANNDISYSHVQPSHPTTTLPVSPVSQLESVQLSQDIAFRREDNQIVQRQTEEKRFTSEGEQLVGEGIGEKPSTGEIRTAVEQGIGDRERVRETEHPLLLEQDVSVNTAHVGPSSQRTERLESAPQGTRHADRRESDVESVNALESASSTESAHLANVESKSEFSARQVRIVENEQLLSPSEIDHEQGSIAHIESTSLLPTILDAEEGELMQREVSRHTEQEIFQNAQTRVREVARQEQAGRGDSPASRRLNPAHFHVAPQQQDATFRATEPVRTPAMPTPLPTIQVSIGRIEVRAVTAPTPQPRAKPTRPSPSLSLEDYLKQKGER